MAFLASVVLARFLMVWLLNSLIPDDTVYADAGILSLWYALFALADAGTAILLLCAARGRKLMTVFYLSACWSALLALEQVGYSDRLQAWDGAVQILTTVAIGAALLWEGVTWKSRSRSSSLRP